MVLLLIIFASIVYLYNSISKIHNEMVGNIEEILVSKASQFSKNIEQEIKLYIKKDIYQTLRDNPDLRRKLEHTFSIIITPSFKYIYILYRDKKGRYRYLLDGSKDEKGEFNQKLDVDKESWDKVYETKQPQILLQNNLDGLWITYLKPIIYDGKVEAVLAIDFSTKLLKYITKIITPIEHVFMYIFGSVVLLMALLLYQITVNIKTKKETLTDALTSVYNRNFLRNFTKKMNPSKYQIAMMDIDYFKKINDNYGHKAGDYVLIEIAYILKRIIREKDIIVRFGGEEFLIFFRKSKDTATNAYEISKRIRETLEEYEFVYDGNPIRVTVSIGVVLYPDRFKNILDAIKKADELLYRAKREGRNKVLLEEDISSISGNEVISINDVKEAIDEGRLVCHYQPIVSLKNYEIIKYEALVRIVTKNGDTIHPGNFLEMITNTSVYNDMTKRVLDIVFDKIKRCKVPISINLNLSDILDNAVYALVLQEIKEHSELSKWLTIELLEYEQIETEILKERLFKIKSYGIKIAIDDFGSGYSNFSVFQALPIDILKIDGSLIKDIHKFKTAYYITESIVSFSEKIGIDIVAEFVHNKEVLDTIKNLNIRCGQGFFLAKPSEEISHCNIY